MPRTLPDPPHVTRPPDPLTGLSRRGEAPAKLCSEVGSTQACPAQLPQAPWSGLSLVLGSIDAVRNGRALAVLLATFAGAGLLLAMAESSLARGAGAGWMVQAGVALWVAFYGGNTAGLLMMDAARGRPVREISSALQTALRSAHCLLLALIVLLAGYALVGSLLLGLLWLCRTSVSGPWLGPVLFGFVVPLGVLVVGLGALTLLVVVPLAAPAVWSGASTWQTVRRLTALMRRRLPMVALLMAAVSLLTAGMGAIATFVVMTGGRVVAELGVAVVGVDVPAQQLMAGLFGYGLRSLGAAGVPQAGGHAAAALIGGGVVFALALLLPGLVYLRGTCAVYLATCEEAS